MADDSQRRKSKVMEVEPKPPQPKPKQGGDGGMDVEDEPPRREREPLRLTKNNTNEMAIEEIVDKTRKIMDTRADNEALTRTIVPDLETVTTLTLLVPDNTGGPLHPVTPGYMVNPALQVLDNTTGELQPLLLPGFDAGTQLAAYDRAFDSIMRLVSPVVLHFRDALAALKDNNLTLYKAIAFVHRQSNTLQSGVTDLGRENQLIQQAVARSNQGLADLETLLYQGEHNNNQRAQLLVKEVSDEVVQKLLRQQKEEHDEQQAKIEALLLEVGKSRQALETYQQNGSGLRDKLAIAEGQIDKVKREKEIAVAERADTVRALEQGNGTLKSQLETVETKFAKLQADYQHHMAITVPHTNVDEEIAKLEEEHRLRIQSIEGQATDARRELDAARITIANLRDEVAKEENTVRTLEPLRASSKKMVHDLEIAQQKLTVLEIESRATKLELESEKKIRALAEENERSLRRLQDATGPKDAQLQLKDLQLTNANREVESVKDRLQALKTELEEERAKTQSSSVALAERLKERTDEVNQAAKLQRIADEKTLKEEQEKAEKLSAQLRHQQLQQTPNKYEIARLESELAQAKKDMERDRDLQAAHEEKWKETVKSLQEQLTKPRAPDLFIQQRIDGLEREAKRLREEAAKANDEIAEKNKDLSELKPELTAFATLRWFELVRTDKDGSYRLASRKREDVGLLSYTGVVYPKTAVDDLITAYLMTSPGGTKGGIGGGGSGGPKYPFAPVGSTRIASHFSLAQDGQITELLAQSHGGEYVAMVTLYDAWSGHPEGLERQLFIVNDVNVYKLPWSGHQAYVVDLARSERVKLEYIKGTTFRTLSANGLIKYTVQRKGTAELASSSYGARPYTLDMQGLPYMTALNVQVNQELQMQASVIGAGYARLNRLYIAVTDTAPRLLTSSTSFTAMMKK